MIGVTWLNTDPVIASARLRSLIPRDILKAQGLVKDGRDVVIAAKHGWSAAAVRKAARVMVMDVCDDHFSGPYAGHYYAACELADAVTCNSREMARIIKTVTNRNAVVIDDPYEDPELPPSASGENVLWFGHKSNLPDLAAIKASIPYYVEVVSNHNWSPEALDAALKRCRCVLIPTGKSRAKSANRAVKAIRYGKYPVCGDLPAHAELGIGSQEILKLLDWAMRADTSAPVADLQKKVRERFCPEKIAKDWYRVIHETESMLR